MAKTLIVNTLVEHLGQFVDGISQENFHLGVFSGTIELNNLQLKSSSLDKLNLPVRVTRGHLSSLQVKIPWTALGSKPVQVKLQGIYLQAEPVDIVKLSTEELRKENFLLKRSLLKQAEDAVIESIKESQTGGDFTENASYLQLLVAKIVANIEILVEDVHIRYEDSQAITGKCFAFGITLSSLSLSTTDDEWNEKFIATRSDLNRINKLGKMVNLGIYWNPDTTSSSDLTEEEWNALMYSMIDNSYRDDGTRNRNSSSNASTGGAVKAGGATTPTKGKANVITPTKAATISTFLSNNEMTAKYYILPTPNNLLVKLILSEKTSDTTPKVNISIEVSNLNVKIDKIQYKQMMKTLENFAFLDRQKQIAVHRPTQRPTHDPRGWWHYVFVLVRGKERTNGFELMSKCLGARKRYILLLKKIRTAESASGSKYKEFAADEAELLKYDESLPLGTLIYFRKIATLDMIKEKKKESVVLTPKKSGNSTASSSNEAVTNSNSWFSWLGGANTQPVAATAGGGGTKDDSNDDEELLRQLKTQFDEIDSNLQKAEKNQSHPIVRLSLDCPLTVRLTNMADDVDIIFIDISTTCQVIVKPKHTHVNFSLNQFVIKDLCSTRPLLPNIVTPKHATTGAAKKSTCSVTFENLDGKNVLTVKAVAVEIAWNEKCINQILGIFMDTNAKSGADAAVGDSTSKGISLYNMNKLALESTATKIQDDFEFIISIEAPKIVIPDTYDVDNGCLLLDAGTLHLYGKVGPLGMIMEVTLNSTNVGMPASIHDRNIVDVDHYLIKPFNMKLVLDSVEKVNADLTMLLDITPAIHASIDAYKIVRVADHFAIVQRSFDVQDKSSSIATSHFAPIEIPKATMQDALTEPVIKQSSQSTKAALEMNISLSLIMIELLICNEDTANPHIVTLSLDGLHAKIMQSSMDLQLNFAMSSIEMLDNYRHNGQNALIWTPKAGAGAPCLINITYTAITSRKSSYFAGYGQELEIIIAQISLSIDQEALLRFHPLLSVLSKKRSYNQLESIEDDFPDFIEVVPVVPAAQHQVAANGPLDGMHISVYIDKVTLALMRQQPAVSADDNLLESVFTSSISGLSGEIQMLERIKGGFLINSFSITDTRNASAKYIYRDLLKRSAQNILYIDPAVATDDDSDDVNLCTILFEQKSVDIMHMEIKIQDLTSYININSIVTIVNVLMKNVDAMMTLVGILQKKGSNDVETATARKGNKPAKSSSITDSIRDYSRRRSMSSAPAIVDISRKPSISANTELSSTVDGSESSGTCNVVNGLFNLTIAVNNPRILLLENPEIASSRAVMLRTGISFYYNRETNVTAGSTHASPGHNNKEQNECAENMHFSLSNIELLVIPDMSVGYQQDIIEPSHFEVNIQRRVENNINLSTKVSVNITEILAKVSLKDLVLMKSVGIQLEKAIAENNHALGGDSAPSNKAPSRSSTPVSDIDSSRRMSTLASVMDISVYSITVHCNSIVVNAINDFFNDYQSIIRVGATDIDVNINGCLGLQDYCGDIAVSLYADFYNQELAAWEPFMEKWYPTVLINSKPSEGLSIELSYQNIVQCNLSGKLIKSVSHAHKLVTQEDNDYRNILSATSSDEYPITFINDLGVPFHLNDSRTGNLLLTLSNSNPAPLIQGSISCGMTTDRISAYPTVYDIYFLDKLGTERLPLLQLPLNINKPRHYYLKPSMKLLNNTNVTLEPIVEDVYENQRWDGIKQRWTRPWITLGEPDEWTDASLKPKSSPKLIKLPSDRWEWLDENWKVDTSGKVGEDIDENGWEYGVDFRAFTVSSKRRTFKPLDTFRRRRWVRARAFKSNDSGVSNTDSSTDNNNRQLNIIWDVQVNSHGNREVYVRTSLQICNRMPFAVSCKLGGLGIANAHNDKHVDLIVPGDGFIKSVPLLSVHASTIKFRPHDSDYITQTNSNSGCSNFLWSDDVDCKLLSTVNGESFVTVKDLLCSGDVKSNNESDICMRAYIKHTAKVLHITILPYAILYNCLPCDLLFKVYNDNQYDNSSDRHVEQGKLSPGASCKLAYVPVSIDYGTRITFQTGLYDWTVPKTFINKSFEITEKKDTHTSGGGVTASGKSKDSDGSDSKMTLTFLSPMNDSDILHMSMNVTVGNMGVVELHCYSRYALRDLTGNMQLVVSTKKVGGGNKASKLGATTSKNNLSATTGGNVFADQLADHSVNMLETTDRKTYDPLVPVDDIKSSWINGANGVCLFHSEDNYAMIGIKNGRIWSGNISLIPILSGTSAQSMTTFEVVDYDNSKVYEFAYSANSMPGMFKGTDEIVVVNKYTIFNCLTDQVIELRQVDDNATYDIYQHEDHGISDKVICVPPVGHRPWIKNDMKKGTTLQLKIQSSAWSIGTVDINDVGSTVLILPLTDRYKARKHQTINGNDIIVLHVEVKFSAPEDNSYLSIVIWQETANTNKLTRALSCENCSYSIKNDTIFPIALQQINKNGEDDDAIINPYIELIEVCVSPSTWTPYGWVDQVSGSLVRVNVGLSLLEKKCQLTKTPVIIDLMKIDSTMNIVVPATSKDSLSTTITLLVRATGVGIVLHIFETGSHHLHAPITARSRMSDALESSNSRDVDIRLYLKSFGLSIIAEQHHRREFMSVYVDGIDIHLHNHTYSDEEQVNKGVTTALDVKIMDIQIDNYSETAIFPVLLHSYNSQERKDAVAAEKRNQALKRIDSKHKKRSSIENTTSADINFLSIACVKDTPVNTVTPIFRYVALKMLELKIALDSSTIQIYLLDLHNDVMSVLETRDQALALEMPEKWIDKYNTSVVTAVKGIMASGDAASKGSPSRPKKAVGSSVAKKKDELQKNKIYVENLILHPLKINFTFAPTPFPRSKSENILATRKYAVFQYIKLVSNIDELIIKINSFIITSSIMETAESLSLRIFSGIQRDIMEQLVFIVGKVFGSMAILGKPAGLYRKVGSGIKSFFYEPYEGMMHSPEGFARGLKIGGKNLAVGIGSGIITSVSTFVGSAAKGLGKAASSVSSDKEYLKKRDEKQLQNSASGGGVKSGMKAGAESVLSGLSSGFAGLVMKPIKEGKKSGAMGFAKGLGQGLVDVVVKPVMGVSDGIAYAAQGVSNQVNKELRILHVRPPRALERSHIEFSELLLVPLSLRAAHAQLYIRNMSKRSSTVVSDEYVTAIYIAPDHNTGNNEQVGKSTKQLTLEQSQLAETVILSEKFIFYINKDGELVWKLAYGDISHCILTREGVNLVAYTSSSLGVKEANSIVSSISNTINAMSNISSAHVAASQQQVVIILTHTRSRSIKLYRALAANSFLMGSPTSVLDLDTAVQALDDQSANPSNRPVSSSGDIDSEGNYIFGSKNSKKFLDLTLKDSAILNRGKERLHKIALPSSEDSSSNNPSRLAYYRQVDEYARHLIHEWHHNHKQLTNSSRCCAAIIINNSNSIVQLLRIDMKEGRNYTIIGIGKGYDAESRLLAPFGGGCVVFSWGFLPTLVDQAHVRTAIFTNSFTAVVATRSDRSTCVANGGSSVGYLEKSVTSHWSKFVIVAK